MPYQMKNGRWRATKMIAGQRKTKICDTKAEAKKWEAMQSEEDWRQKTPTVCLHEVATAYLDYSQMRHHKNTYDSKRLAMKRMFQYVRPDAAPDAVTNRIALAYVMDRMKESGPKAANKDRKHMAAFWEWAKKYYAYPDNPFQQVAKLPENTQPHYVPPAADFWKVYAVADETDKVMLLALLYTAGRRSEPMRWTWEEDIDLPAKRIRLSTCKTADGSRKYEWLTMPKRLHDALCAHKVRTGGRGHVFVSKRTGQPYAHRNKFIHNLCQRAGVKPFNYHGIRGLCASLLAEGGVPMKEIQHVLMHSSMTTTDRYIRRLGGTNDVLGAAFDKFEETRTAGKVIPFPAAQ